MSDNEGGEKPVREKLKQTTITNPTSSQIANKVDVTSHPTSVADSDLPSESTPPSAASDSNEGKVRRKRSFEDVDKDEEMDADVKDTPSRHVRKRSRDSDKKSPDVTAPVEEKKDHAMNGSVSKGAQTPPQDDKAEEAAASELLKSPKGKRNREQFLEDDEEQHITSINHTVAATSEKSGSETGKNDDGEERGAKRPRDSDKTESKEKKEHDTCDTKEKALQVKTISAMLPINVLTNAAAPRNQCILKRLIHFTLRVSGW